MLNDVLLKFKFQFSVLTVNGVQLKVLSEKSHEWKEEKNLSGASGDLQNLMFLYSIPLRIFKIDVPSFATVLMHLAYIVGRL